MAFEPNLGPSYLFYGDPTQADGAGMQNIGKTRGDVIFNPDLGIMTGFADQTGRTPLADVVYDSGPMPVFTAPLVDEEKAKLLSYMVNANQIESGGNSAIGFSSGIKRIPVADIGTLAAIPVHQVDEGTNGIDAPNAVWLPRCIAASIGEFTFNLPDGDDILNPHSVEFRALYHETDQAAASIEADLRYGFIGTPNASSALTWSLPAITD